MYRLMQRFLPGLGNEPEVRALLTEMTQQLHAADGRDVGLSAELFSSDGPSLVVATRAEDLNTLEEYRHRTQANVEWQSRVVKLVRLLRAPVQARVFETLIRPGGSGPTGIVTRTFGFPALGKDAEFGSIAEDAVKSSQAAGVRRGLLRQLLSSTGQVYEVITLYPDLAAFDQTRKERFAVTSQAVQALHHISREPIKQRVFEVLVSLRN